MRRLAAVFLALCLLACTGCSAGSDTSEPVSGDDRPTTPSGGGVPAFSVAYAADDSLDPFSAKTEANIELAGLLFEGLTVIDADFMPQNALASATELTDATHLTVTLRRDALFSDGSAVTAADVTDSFRRARSCAAYKALLSNVTSVSAEKKNSDRLVFTLAQPDPNAAACLSFPIVKAASSKNAGGFPIGTGLYMAVAGESGVSLVANPHTKKPLRYKTVGLRDLPNSDAMYYGFASGAVTWFYNDLNDGSAPRIAGSGTAVNMNALLYLGVNADTPALANTSVRQALSMLIDRRSLANTALSGWALPAATPFHPAWGALETSFEVGRDLTAAVEKLESAGYTGDREPLALELIYCDAQDTRTILAEHVCAELESTGLAVTKTPLKYAEYMARLASGEYDLYLGEVRLSANMDLSPLFHGGRAGYGVPRDSAAGDAYVQYRAGEITLEAFVTAFAEDMPYIPLCWKCGFVGYDRRLTTVTPHGYNPYYGFENWQ